MKSGQRYAPPVHPPPGRSRLKSSETYLPYPIDLEKLSNQGWAILPLTDDPSDPLYSPFFSLFESSAQFFELPEDEREKYRVKPLRGGASQVSEEGYSRVEGEKLLLALRKARTTPTEFQLRERAEEAWRASASIMRDALKAIEESLEMNDGALMRLTEKQLELPGEDEESVATLMRVFRYDRPSPPEPASWPKRRSKSTGKGFISKVVSEPHRDLGILTIVIGHSPGLECWDAECNDWVSCETNERGLNATILVGQTLTKFTNGRFVAGRHRVFVHPQLPSPSDTNPNPSDPSSPLSSPSYRFSLVHALRGHLPTRVSHTDFQSPVTTAFPSSLQFTDVTVGEIYQAISDAHWNVNISVEERRKQERALKERERRERGRARRGEAIGGGNGRGRFGRILDVFSRVPRRLMATSTSTN